MNTTDNDSKPTDNMELLKQEASSAGGCGSSAGGCARASAGCK